MTTVSFQSYEFNDLWRVPALILLWKLISDSKARWRDEIFATLVPGGLVRRHGIVDGSGLPRPRIFTGQRMEFGVSHS